MMRISPTDNAPKIIIWKTDFDGKVQKFTIPIKLVRRTNPEERGVRMFVE